MAFNRITEIRRFMLFSVSIVMIDKGASFCHVDNIIAVGQDIIFIVGGNQK